VSGLFSFPERPGFIKPGRIKTSPALHFRRIERKHPWQMKPLPYPNNQHLEAAEGWLELGNYLEANEELEKITPQLRAHPFVLEIRFKIYSEANRWEMALEVAKGMSNILPDNPWGPFHLAFSLHELKRTKEAYEVLIPVVDKFPNEWLMRYNLACYSCRLGNLKEAEEWFELARDMAGKIDIRQMALEDEDLEPLWTEISEI
jgi:tetratricopeptide (TPR) repeat protein